VLSLVRRLSTWRYPHLLSTCACNIARAAITRCRHRRSAENPPVAVAAVDRWDRRTDVRTDARPSHRPWSAYYGAASIKTFARWLQNSKPQMCDLKTVFCKSLAIAARPQNNAWLSQILTIQFSLPKSVKKSRCHSKWNMDCSSLYDFAFHFRITFFVITWSLDL